MAGSAATGSRNESPYADDPMTQLWQDANHRQTGTEAVEALRQRKRQETETAPTRRARWRRG